jgi:mono/diheme cytochrome c family protein
MTTGDHHTAYLARAVAALTPEGRARVDELLDQLAAVAGGRERLARFADARREEADRGRTGLGPDPALTDDEIDALAAGFMTIRDQEPRDDVADWANAVLALLQDEAARP